MKALALLLVSAALSAQSTVTITAATQQAGYNPAPQGVTIFDSFGNQVASTTINQGQNIDTGFFTTIDALGGGSSKTSYRGTRYDYKFDGSWGATVAIRGFDDPSLQPDSRHSGFVAAVVTVTNTQTNLNGFLFVRTEMGTPVQSLSPQRLGVVNVYEVDAVGAVVPNGIVYQRNVTVKDWADFARHPANGYPLTIAQGTVRRFRIEMRMGDMQAVSTPYTGQNWLDPWILCRLSFSQNNPWKVTHTAFQGGDKCGGSIVPNWDTSTQFDINYEGVLDMSLNPAVNFAGLLTVGTVLNPLGLSPGYAWFLNDPSTQSFYLPWVGGNFNYLLFTLPPTIPPPGAPVYAQFLMFNVNTGLAGSFASPLIRFN